MQWSTAQEENSDYFNIQRSVDGKNFTNIATVSAAGTSNTVKNYSYTDKDVENLNDNILFYRLSETDKDGAITNSDIKTINLGNRLLQFSVYPNPAKDFINIVAPYNLANALIRITGINGNRLLETKLNFSAGQQLKIQISQFEHQVLILTISGNSIYQQFKVIRQ